MGKRHMTRAEIIAQCKAIARESRMAERSPWSAMGIVCAYVIYKSEGFKAKRIVDIVHNIDAMQEQFERGELTIDDLNNKLMAKADFGLEAVTYTEADIKTKKGSYQYWIDSRQLGPQNTINEMSIRYMLFFFNTLVDKYGFGKTRLERVYGEITKFLIEYQQDKTSIRMLKEVLLNETGIVFEMPIDPLTQTTGSMMTN